MAPLDLIGSFFALAALALGTLAQISLWQQKEYRADRFTAHMREPQNRLTRHPLALTGMAAIAVGWLAYLANAPALAELAGWAGLISFVSHHVGRAKRRGVLRPDVTLKAATATLLTLALLGLYLRVTFVPAFFVSLQGATALLLLPILTAASVALANVPFAFLKERILRRAKRARASRPQLRVVGITGSYGKTSTKHFLEHIVRAAGRKVAATEAHHNTPIGVGQDMLAALQTDIDIYIAELGAYRPGEVRKLAGLVQPQIGVLTAVANQHLGLFGSVDNILKAKWELVESLPKDGPVVINADDPRLAAAAASESRPVLRYSLTHKADVWVEHVHFEPTLTTCRLHLAHTAHSLTLPLASEALLSSAVAAAAAALALNIPSQEIATALTSLAPFPRTMEIRPGKGDATVIDDSYSGNEAGTLAAVRHLGRFRKGDRRVVLYPLIELGADAARVHRRIGEAVREVGAKLYVLGNSYRHELGPGVYEADPRKLAVVVSRGLNSQTVVLLENRLPDVVRNAILA